MAATPTPCDCGATFTSFKARKIHVESCKSQLIEDRVRAARNLGRISRSTLDEAIKFGLVRIRPRSSPPPKENPPCASDRS